MMHLYNGRIQLVLKTRKRVELSTQAVFNDGLWHKVILINNDHSLDTFGIDILFDCFLTGSTGKRK